MVEVIKTILKAKSYMLLVYTYTKKRGEQEREIYASYKYRFYRHLYYNINKKCSYEVMCLCDYIFLKY